MKTFILCAGLMGTAVSLAMAADGAPAPRIQFAELAHDFGKIEAGTVTPHRFIFTNTGNATLTITDVRPGCGCTTAGTWDRVVEPGKTGGIPLQFNSTGFSGAVTKSATVTCNDPAQSNIYLQLKATIWRPIEVTPATVYFNLSAESPANERRTVRIVNNLEAPLTLSAPESTNQAFRTELATVKPGKEFELRVTAQPRPGSMREQGSVTLKTSATNSPLLTIPVYANIQPAVVVAPAQLALPTGPLATPLRPTVTIRNTGTNAMTLSDAMVNLPGAAVEVKELQPGKVFTLAVSFPAGLKLDAGRTGEISVKSSHPKFPVIKVPIIQSQAPTTLPASARISPTGPVRNGPPAPPPLLARPPEPPPTR